MDPSVKKGIKRRQDWMRRYPGAAGDYIRLRKSDRDRVDQLFLANRKLKANEVTSEVERLTEIRLLRGRTDRARSRALTNIRAQLGDIEKYRDDTVVTNVRKMSTGELRTAATSNDQRLRDLASVQEPGNPFWYH